MCSLKSDVSSLEEDTVTIFERKSFGNSSAKQPRRLPYFVGTEQRRGGTVLARSWPAEYTPNYTDALLNTSKAESNYETKHKMFTKMQQRSCHREIKVYASMIPGKFPYVFPTTGSR